MLVILLIILLAAHILVLVICTVFLFRKHFSESTDMDMEIEFQEISVLVAARNEEKNILKCLQSLTELNYPKDKIEILIGNDSSTDKTAEIVNNFIHNKPNFKLIEIKNTVGNARGKANVLAQLARMAEGKYFFITDADIEVSTNWVSGHLKHFSGNVYMSSGTTIARGKGIWAKMQQLEWTYLMGLFNAFDSVKSLTAMGNNMAINSEAYFKTGGYEKIPFSVTEDVQLMREFQKLNYGHKHILSAETLSFTEASTSLEELLKQRQRWYAGAKDQPFYIWLLFLIYALFFPALIVLFFIEPNFAVYALLAKCLVDAIFLLIIQRIIKLGSRNLLLLPFFELYLFFINPLILFYSVISKKVQWKQREF